MATGRKMSDHMAVVCMRQSTVTTIFSFGQRFSSSRVWPPRMRRRRLPPTSTSTRGGVSADGRSRPRHQPLSSASRARSSKAAPMAGSDHSGRFQRSR